VLKGRVTSSLFKPFVRSSWWILSLVPPEVRTTSTRSSGGGSALGKRENLKDVNASVSTTQIHVSSSGCFIRGRSLRAHCSVDSPVYVLLGSAASYILGSLHARPLKNLFDHEPQSRITLNTSGLVSTMSKSLCLVSPSLKMNIQFPVRGKSTTDIKMRLTRPHTRRAEYPTWGY